MSGTTSGNIAARQVDQQCVYFGLAERVAIGGFADIDTRYGIRDQLQYFTRDQAVINHRVGTLYQAQGLYSQ